tara:strand:+ start:1188 stop:1610 length:423 start_codon:yes stop_codon:yes gene_type:complete
MLKLDKIFKNKCLYKKNGKRSDDIGLISYIYLFILVIFFIFNIFGYFDLIIKFNKLKKNNMLPKSLQITNTKIIIAFITNLIISILQIIFFYNMAKICRGFLGFILLLIISIIINKFIKYITISNSFMKDIEVLLLMNDN